MVLPHSGQEMSGMATPLKIGKEGNNQANASLEKGKSIPVVLTDTATIYDGNIGVYINSTMLQIFVSRATMKGLSI
jgi:hypothetical protein